MNHLAGRWNEINKRIQQASNRVGRNPNEIGVVAVTKYLDVEQTDQVLRSGFTHLGESRVQDGQAKVKQLGSQGTWHFIGHLQRNKVKQVVDSFHYLHSLDSFRLAQAIEAKAAEKQTTIRCFVQVNVANEKTKFGISSQELEDFVGEISNMSSIEMVGLMTMSPRVENQEEVRPVFRELKRLQKEVQKKLQIPIPHLSMGMSQDFETAIEEGATWIRLGQILVKG